MFDFAKRQIVILALFFFVLSFVSCYTIVTPPTETRSSTEYEQEYEEYDEYEEYEGYGDTHNYYFNYPRYYDPWYWGNRHLYSPFGYGNFYGYLNNYPFGFHFGSFYSPSWYNRYPLYSFYSPIGYYGGYAGYSGFLGYPYYLGGYYPIAFSTVSVNKKRDFSRRGAFSGSRIVARSDGNALGIQQGGLSALAKNGTANKSSSSKRSVVKSASSRSRSSGTSGKRTVTRSTTRSTGRVSAPARSRTTSRGSMGSSPSRSRSTSGRHTVTKKGSSKNQQFSQELRSYNSSIAARMLQKVRTALYSRSSPSKVRSVSSFSSFRPGSNSRSYSSGTGYANTRRTSYSGRQGSASRASGTRRVVRK